MDPPLWAILDSWYNDFLGALGKCFPLPGGPTNEPNVIVPPRGRGFHHEGWVGELRERHRGLWPGDGGWIESDGTDVQVMNE